MDLLRNIGEIGFGVLFLIGAVFNATYTRTHAEEFHGSFSDGAWLSPARQMIEKVVIPNAAVFTVFLVLFQATVAVMILLRGDSVAPALLVGGGFALVAAGASSPGGTVANPALAALQFILALTRLTIRGMSPGFPPRIGRGRLPPATLAQPSCRHTLTSRPVVDQSSESRSSKCRCALFGELLVMGPDLVIGADHRECRGAALWTVVRNRLAGDRG